jgi:SAM-dependent methyltransferase
MHIRPPQALLLCRKCGLGWLDAAQMADHVSYEDEYFSVYQESRSFQGGVDDLPAHLVLRLEDLERLNGGRPGCLLEVGCGFGPFLAVARDRGWTVHGTDISKWAARRIAKRYGLHVEVGDIMTVPLPEGVDAIHVNHTLEHLPDPVGALRRLHGALRPEGWLIVEVPNELTSLFERIRWKVLRRPTPPLTETNPHVFFFTPRALRIVMTRAGFDILSLGTARRAEDHDSAIPFGTMVKAAIYALERRWNAGPNIIAVAFRGRA